jgi:hypothetical protein
LTLGCRVPCRRTPVVAAREHLIAERQIRLASGIKNVNLHNLLVTILASAVRDERLLFINRRESDRGHFQY